MLRRFVLSAVLLLTVLATGAPAQAEKRIALVVGNATYARAGALRNPANDAKDMATALQGVGFEVLLGLDLDHQSFARKLDEFAQRLDDADVGLFFYAGHGLQLNEKNYLVSTNAQLTSEFLIPSETIELDAIVRLMESKTATNLVFLDACRNNPLAENLKKNLASLKRSASVGRGLARVEPNGRDTLVAFAAAPGQEAADGAERNSPFTTALLKHMPKPDQEVSVMLKDVAADVRATTKNAQRPQQLSDMTHKFYFAKADAPAAPPASAAAQAAGATAGSLRQLAQVDDRALDLAYWNTAQAANDCDSIRAYVQRFPAGVFIDLAKAAERRLCQQGRRIEVVALPPGQAPAAPGTAPEASAPPAQPPQEPPAQTAAVKPPSIPARPVAADASEAGRDCARCPPMVELPGGAVSIGSNDDASEKPAHLVEVGAFALGRFPVTVGEWKECVAAKACTFEPQGEDDAPAHGLNWNDAQQYVAWLSRLTRKQYRLPTEAEWEYAARGGASTKFWWGNQPKLGMANCKGCGEPYSPERPTRVGSFPANPFGLHDMIGGVEQWVADCWHKDYAGAPKDGSSWDMPNCRERVKRGGSWKTELANARVSWRDRYNAGVRYPTHGLRVARSR